MTGGGRFSGGGGSGGGLLIVSVGLYGSESLFSSGTGFLGGESIGGGAKE